MCCRAFDDAPYACEYANVNVNTIGCGHCSGAGAEAEIEVASVVASAHFQLPPSAAAARAHNANANIKGSRHTDQRTRLSLQALDHTRQCPPPHRHPIARARQQPPDALDADMQYQAADSAPLNPFRGGGGSPYSPTVSPLNGTQQPAASVPPRTPLQALQAKLDSFDRRQLVLIIVFIAIFLDNMLLTTVGAHAEAAHLHLHH